jgi:alkylation response protein AidB-like acyl-CoA dehydrogenase
MATLTKSTQGGEYLIKDVHSSDIFIPEQFTEEQRMMAQACQDFIDTEITPNIEEIDSMKNPELVPSIFKKAGELGLLGITVPEQYGGMGMSFNTSMLIADIIGASGSFSTTYGAHTGIGTLPILYSG